MKAELERSRRVTLQATERLRAPTSTSLYRDQLASVCAPQRYATPPTESSLPRHARRLRGRLYGPGRFFRYDRSADALLAIRLLDGRLVGSVDEIARTTGRLLQRVSSSLQQFNSGGLPT